MGVRTGARILLEVGDGSAFASAGHLAAYAGIASVTHRSGTSIRGEHPDRSGNRKLKRALFLSAFAALHDPASRTYYDRKRAEGKKRNAALMCLARRHCDLLYAMLKNKTFYQPNPPQQPDTKSLEPVPLSREQRRQDVGRRMKVDADPFEVGQPLGTRLRHGIGDHHRPKVSFARVEQSRS